MKLNFKKLTNGVFNCTADFILWQIGIMGGMIGKSSSSREVHQAFNEASEFLDEVNHQTLRGAWQRLKRQGLIDIIKEEGFYKPVLTSLAKKRLKSLVPEYQKQRPWDKKIYIITYDIPEKKLRARNLLRENIKKLGGAMIQKSVWICPYNIKGLLDQLVKEIGIEDTVIVSNTGTDGAIGNQSIEELIVKVYELEALNERYKEFLSLIKKECKKSRQELIVYYLSVLQDDPQLPFELLPYWWLGEEAYKEYKKLLSKEKGND